MAASHKLRSPDRRRRKPATTPDTIMTTDTTSDASARHTFVLGIFPGPAAAARAVRNVSAHVGGGDDTVLVVKGRFPGAIAARAPFDALWSSLSGPAESQAGRSAPGGKGRLVRDLAERVAKGACVVIGRPTNHDQQLALSRALLEAGCEVLLTHEITMPTRARPAQSRRQKPVFYS